jgi:uncharacterized protein YpiB (UPF0302 family)
MDVIVVAEKSTEQFIQYFYPNYDTQRQVAHSILIYAILHNINYVIM